MRHRDFRLYAPAGFVSNVGLWVQRIGVQWLAWSLTESYAWLAAVALAEAATLMAFLPLFGALTQARANAVLTIVLASALLAQDRRHFRAWLAARAAAALRAAKAA